MSGAVCPCTLVKPCRDACSCGNALLSGGCDRCATYGSAAQRLAAAEWIVRRLAAADDVAGDDCITWEDEDSARPDRRQVWCRWCQEGMLATEFVALESQDRDFPHTDDCTWVLAGGRE